MRVLLVNPKTGTRYPQIPLGILSLGGMLKAAGHEPVVVDRNTGATIEDVVESARGVEAVGLSVWSCGLEDGKEISAAIRAVYPGLPIIAGGPHASALPEQTARELGCKAVVVGEGEQAILDVLADLTLGEQRGRVVPITTTDIADLPRPAYELVDWRKYRPHPPHGKWTPFVPMVASRGCPYQCRFCSKSVFGSKHRSKHTWQVVAEIDFLKGEYGVKEVAFYDDTFTLDRKWAIELCGLLEREKVGIHWSCETRVNTVDAELLGAMKRAGCFSVSFGIESASQKTLDYIRKGITVEQVEKAVKEARKVGLSVTGYFMFVPGVEGVAERAETVKLAKRLKLDYAQFSTLTPLPGSALYDPVVRHERYGGLGDGDSPEARATREFYTRPGYVAGRVAKACKSWPEMKLLVKGVAMMVGGNR